jgi:diguanylate cyclase (GGDEF)-like protein
MKPVKDREGRIADLVRRGWAADFDSEAFDQAFRRLGADDEGEAALWFALLSEWTGQRFDLGEAQAMGVGVRRAFDELAAALGRPLSLQTALVHELHSRRGALAEPRLVPQAELQSLRHGTLSDPQTGLYNRRFLEDHLDRELSRSERGSAVFSLVLLEVPGLSQVARALGGEAGASLVEEASRRIHDSLRVVDAGGRFEDDRFMALLPNTDLFHGIEVAERIRQNLSRLEAAGNGGGLAADYGVATFPLDGRTRSFLLKMTDVRLYSSRASTRSFTSARRYPRFLVSGLSLKLGTRRGERSSADVHDVSYGGLSFDYRGTKVPPLIEGELSQRFSTEVHPVTLRRVSVTPSAGGRVRVNCAYAH